MATVKGTWIFKEKLILDSTSKDFAVIFSSNGETFQGISLLGPQMTYYDGAAKEDVDVYSHYLGSSETDEPYGFEWVDANYRTIYFGEDELTVTDAFYTWLLASASAVEPVEQNTLVTYDGQDVVSVPPGRTAVLACAGRVMEADLVITGGVSEVTEGIIPTGTKTLTTNGTHDVTNYALANVNVEPKTSMLTVTKNDLYKAADGGLDGFSEVDVSLPLGPKTITANGTYPASDDDYQGFTSVTVNVPTSGGSGGGIETCAFTIISDSAQEYPYSCEICIPYIDDNGALQHTFGYESLYLPEGQRTFNTPKGAMILLAFSDGNDHSAENFEYVGDRFNNYSAFYKITGDATIYID